MNPNNYQPISILSALSKVFEKLIYKSMLKFINKHKVFAKEQFGFRQKRCCQQAIISATEFIRDILDRRFSGAACFLDLTKAFDSIDHKILLRKLEFYGFRGVTNRFLESYLSNRSQRVYANGRLSQAEPFTCGVPQGSVLGPLLFLLHINDLPASLSESKVTLYADDTSILTADKLDSTEHLQREVTKADDWCNQNRLTINSSKSETMFFGSNTPSNQINLGSSSMERVSTFKFLGVWKDNKLNFNCHVDSVMKRLAKFNGVLYKARSCFSQCNLLRFYDSYAKPIISYGILAYGTTSKAKMEKILIMQKRLLRTIFFLKRSQSVTHLFDDHGIETVYDLYFHQLFKESIEQYIGVSEFPLKLYKPALDQGYITRSKTKGLLKVPKFRSNVMSKSLGVKISKALNFFITLNLLPGDLDTYTEAKRLNFLNDPLKTYYKITVNF